MKVPKIYAHRGFSRIAPENTMAAFEKAVETGADGIELDIQLTCDDKLAVVHDLDLGRTCDGKGKVSEHTLKELKTLDFGSWFSDEYTGQRIPELPQVLELISDTEMLLNIELKTLANRDTSVFEKKLLDEISDSKCKDRILISSFDHNLLQRIKNEDMTVNIAPLYVGAFVDIGSYAKELAATAVNPVFGSLDKNTVSQIQSHGIEVNTWTVDKITEFETAVDYGVDGVITNDPGSLIKVR